MATVSLATMRSRLRVYLSDTNSKLWPDDGELDLFLNHAIVKFTHDVPIAASQTYTVATDQQGDANTYLVPADFVRDRFLRASFYTERAETVFRLHMEPGVWVEGDEPTGYVLDFPDEGSLYLPREPQSAAFTLYYDGYWDVWLAEDLDEFDLGRRRWGEEAVYAYAAFLAFNPSSARRAQLEQWARRGDQNVGNPLEEEAARWKAHYQELLAEHGASPMAWAFVQRQSG